ncbi:methyltransferase domain-containing protein [bacterium]|jgi:ubiquinone/menaquinone biosynthesis C-methylase UbiE|nr:methyltransferase domain-containing protein [bacterium]
MSNKNNRDLNLSNEFWQDEPNKFYEHYRPSINPISFFAKLFLKQRNAWALSKVALHKNDIIADIGCGSGELLDILAHSSKTVYAIDISEKMLEKSKSNNKLNNIKYIQSACDPCPIDSESVNKIVSLGVLDYVSDINSYVAEFNRILKLGGIAIITSPKSPSLFSFLRWFNSSRKVLTKMPPLVNIFSKKEIQEILHNADLEVLEISPLWTTMWLIVVKKSKNKD